MTDDEALAIYDDETREAQCTEYLKASVITLRSIFNKEGQDGDDREIFPHMLAALLTAEVIFLNTNWRQEDWPEAAKETIVLCVVCNDLFAIACSDAERVSYKEISDLYRHWEKDPVWGPSIWCLKKRGQMPQGLAERKIREAGLWDLDALGLSPNTQNAEVRQMIAAVAARRASDAGTSTSKEKDSQ